MEQAAKATISLSPSYAAAAGCCMAACPYRSTRRLCRGSRGGCSARSSSSLRHAPSAAPRVYAAAAATPEPKTKEEDLVFIAGATGKVGSRAVRELIKLGFRVRAGVRSAQRASSLVQSVEQLKLDGDATSQRLEIVECDLEKQAQADIVSAIGNAAIVVCSIGASEKDILDVTGPYRIDYVATNNLVQAATAAKIVRPGGMERPTDAFKETHNLVVAVEDTYVGGLVSNLQVAELIACIASNRRAAYCKVVEAVAETTAPLLLTEDQLANIPSKRQPPPEIEVDKQGKKLAMAPPKPKQQSQRPLSPYTAFVDLKPPSSASPCPPSAAAPAPTSTDTAPAGSSSVLNSSATGTPISGDQPKQQQRPLSPYTRYEELKPPSSPSPTPPSAASSASVSASANTPAAAAASSAPLDSSANGTPITGDQLNQQQKPLSPYTRYEELKPPSSPTPSAPKL